jgi:hypothetical protein
MRHILALFFLLSSTCFIFGQNALGTWREYLNYSNAIDVDVLGDEVYTATRNAIFIYNRVDNSLSKLNKINGLNDVGVVLIRAYPEMNAVVIGYENGNIDIIKDREIIGFPDIKNSSAIGDKTIRHIYFYQGIGYITTGLGIFEFDVERVEIKDTYSITATGDISINQVTVLNDTMYAASDEGLYFGKMSDDLSIFSNWQQDLSIPLPFGPIVHCDAAFGVLYLNIPSATEPGLYARFVGSTWTLARPSVEISSMRATPLGIGYTTRTFYEIKQPNGQDPVAVGSSFGGQQPSISRMTASSDGYIWFADRSLGLVRRAPDNTFEFIAPDGPATNRAFSVNFQQNQLWVASGATERPGLWSNRYILDGFYGYKNGSWQNFSSQNFTPIEENLLTDVTDVIVDPTNPERIYAGSWFSGLAEIENGVMTNLYSTENSPLGEREQFVRPDGIPYVAVSGFATDAEDNIWMANGYSESPLCVKSADGTFTCFSLNNVVGPSTPIVNVIVTRDGHKWMIKNRTGLVVFSDNGTIADESDDETARALTAQVGQGGLPNNEVFAIAEDLDGQIWVGTSDGIAVFFSPFDIFSSNPSDARQILVEQDGIFQYLFERQSVSAIAIDGANRKWIGTFGSGVFLMSSDGTEQLRRFTTDNSPLISNNINDIAIDPKSGEVYIATEEGLMSYVSDATQGELSNQCLSVFPNPVRETYTGPISITGLMRDSEVRITDTRGNLVYSTVSNGGKAVWDGLNLNNERVATGVYFALSADREGTSTCVSKILVIK